MAGDLGKRVAVAAVGIPVAVLLLYAGGWVLAGALALVAAAGAAELCRMAARLGRPFTTAAMGAAALLPLIAAARPSVAGAAPLAWPVLVALLLAALAATIWTRGPTEAPLAAASTTVIAALYTGGTLAYAVFLRHLDPAGAPGAPEPLVGATLLAFPIALTWLSDTFAYFGGRRWGSRKLIPSVSPGKTVAGSVTAVAGSVLVGALYAAVVFQAWAGVPLGIAAGALGGALISVTAQVGDLAESLLKREAGVKDSGALLPGHGGVLDRFDALFFTLPVSYWYLITVLPGPWMPGAP